MTENIKDYARKHREDVIDTLQLWARERRVCYALLLMLLATVMYENGSTIFAGLLNENFEVAVLGEKKSLSIKPDILKKLGRVLEPVVAEYPQYAARLEQDAASLSVAASMAAKPELAEQAIENGRAVVLRLYEFVSHPVIARTSSLEALEKELLQVGKLLQIKPGSRFTYLTLNFKKASSVAEGQGLRNLFDFN